MKILIISDKVYEPFYTSALKERCSDVDLVLSCGDLPYSYLEFFIDTLNVPLFFVRGNHGQKIEYSENKERTYPWGAEDMNGRVLRHEGLIFAGFDGCIRYREGDYQYTQFEMWLKVLAMAPKLLWNKIFYGRYLDILISHSPPKGVNDMENHTHEGFYALRWMLKVFKPDYHFHGHVHLYDNNAIRETLFVQTKVINAYKYYFVKLDQNKGGRNE